MVDAVSGSEMLTDSEICSLLIIEGILNKTSTQHLVATNKVCLEAKEIRNRRQNSNHQARRC